MRTTMTRPNIVLIQADQLTAKVLSMYGGRTVKTPHMDAIASNGVTFRNAYCNNPVCGPSRASMMTGQLSSAVGCYDNAGELLSSIPTFAHYLRHLGYRTCLSGKMHFAGADQLHGFEDRITTDIYPSDFGWTADWSQQDEPYAPSRMSLRSIVEAGVCKRSLQIDYDEDVCFQAVQKIYDYARLPDKQPFMLMASFTHPHNPFVTTQEFWDLYDHDTIGLPGVAHIPIANRDPWSQRYAFTIREDEHTITAANLRNVRHAYYGMVSYFDSLIGRLLKALDDGGFTDNTYVFVIADHGEMLGERGTWFKFLPYEWSTRVPMIARGPGVKKGYVEDKGVSLMDLLPTFLDLATGGKPPALADRLDGRSLAAMLGGDNSGRGDDRVHRRRGLRAGPDPAPGWHEVHPLPDGSTHAVRPEDRSGGTAERCGRNGLHRCRRSNENGHRPALELRPVGTGHLDLTEAAAICAGGSPERQMDRMGSSAVRGRDARLCPWRRGPEHDGDESIAPSAFRR
jgi:choline-sulfatase